MKLVHADLKPDNILVSPAASKGTNIFKSSCFGVVHECVCVSACESYLKLWLMVEGAGDI
jgi:hypothetical protein